MALDKSRFEEKIRKITGLSVFHQNLVPKTLEITIAEADRALDRCDLRGAIHQIAQVVRDIHLLSEGVDALLPSGDREEARDALADVENMLISDVMLAAVSQCGCPSEVLGSRK